MEKEQLKEFTIMVPYQFVDIEQVHDCLPEGLRKIEVLQKITDYARAMNVSLDDARLSVESARAACRYAESYTPSQP